MYGNTESPLQLNDVAAFGPGKKDLLPLLVAALHYAKYDSDKLSHFVQI